MISNIKQAGVKAECTYLDIRVNRHNICCNDALEVEWRQLCYFSLLGKGLRGGNVSLFSDLRSQAQQICEPYADSILRWDISIYPFCGGPCVYSGK